tara:strand:+ start:3196 stop:4599 length:1404 start_codon:yes stop_codon:yes gene_type:complete
MSSLYIHGSHDGSVTLIDNKKIIFHHQIDRFNRFKHTASPSFKIFEELISLNKKIEKLFFTFYPKDHTVYFWQKYLTRLKIIGKSTKITYCTDSHHIFHASCAKLFYPKTDYFLVWDQQGSKKDSGIEQETLYTNKFNQVYSNSRIENSNIGLGERYAIATRLSGFNELEDGKTMALSQYKKPGVAFFEQKRLEKKSLHLLKTLEKLHFKKGDTVCLTGGVAQNIINNSNLQKKIKDINIVACPFNGDFGISLGAAAYYEDLHRVYIPLKNIYTGLKTELDLYRFNKYKQEKVTYHDVCKIMQKEPVAIFQSLSEQGQRGLGNRSLLIDIKAPNALKKINKIKKREWFRPFSCSILEDEAHKWFHTKGKLSPYMMFVFKSKKASLTKPVCSVDNLSRIQTVAYSHNKHFHNLLLTNKRFYKRPLLLNTSLNLPGHVLVESLDDLLYMFINTDLKYIYLPEREIIIKK